MSVLASKREKGTGERSSEMLGSPERGFHVPGEKKKEKDSNRIITCLHDSSDK